MSVVLLGPSKQPSHPPGGVRIRHRTKRHGIALVPIPTKPLMGLHRKCPTCQVTHTLKTVHLALDATGACIVSHGVLADLQAAGMPNLDIVADIVDPPAITLGGDRLEVDQANSKIRIWKEPVIV